MFKPHYGKCICHGEQRLIVVKKGYCQEGNEQQKREKKGLSKAIPKIKPISDKKAKQDIAYRVIRESFLKRYPHCQAGIRGICTGEANTIHHKKGRIGELYLDEKYFLASCMSCHIWIEANPAMAIANGFSEKRLTK